jgi:hypothetical protein
VVISDDEVYAALAGQRGGFVRGDATIDGDDELRALVGELGDGFGVEAVAFLDAVGDVELDRAAQEGDGVPENGSGGDAVNVVVAVDDDSLAIADGLGDALGGLAKVGDGEGIVQMPERRAEEGGAVTGVGDASVEQDLGKEWRGLEPGRQLLGGGVGRGDVPTLVSRHPCGSLGEGIEDFTCLRSVAKGHPATPRASKRWNCGRNGACSSTKEESDTHARGMARRCSCAQVLLTRGPSQGST